MPNDSEPTWDSTTEVAPTWEQTAPAQTVIQPSQTQPSQSREATRPTVSLPNLTDVLFGGGGQYVRNAQEAAGDIAKSIPQMVEQLPEMAHQGFQLAHGTPQETTQAIAQIATQGKQQADQIV